MGTPGKARMIAKVLYMYCSQQQHARRPTPEWTQLTSGITASAVEKSTTFIRDPSNSSRTSQLENWQQQ
jgi:hypothetical protein